MNLTNFFNNNLHETKTDLCDIMNKWGSDKGSGHHNYTTFYHFIFKDIKDEIKNVFELGLGTNDMSIPSNMSGLGTPCGSLRGWREYFNNANIYGADIDEKILINEERIKTFKCDQTNTNSIEQLWKNFDFQFDVIIEDGLHTFNANKIFFENSINILKDGGIFIIEDIDKRYHSDFNNFINQVKNRYKFIDLVKIPNSRNDGDNNIILVIK
jgi:hypothetical protein